jgi:hypothetical protein
MSRICWTSAIAAGGPDNFPIRLIVSAVIRPTIHTHLFAIAASAIRKRRIHGGQTSGTAQTRNDKVPLT